MDKEGRRARSTTIDLEEKDSGKKKRRRAIIVKASQAFVDNPRQTDDIKKQLFFDLATNQIPKLQGKSEEGIKEGFNNSPVGARLKIVRGMHQALRGALSHLAFARITEGILPSLENNLKGNSLIPSAKDVPHNDAYICEEIDARYQGQDHVFMITGVYWTKQQASDFFDSIKRKGPEHKYYSLLTATHEVNIEFGNLVREQKENDAKKGSKKRRKHIIYEDFESYQPRFLANLNETMRLLVAAQMGYIQRLESEGINSLPHPDEVVNLVLRNLETFSLPANMESAEFILKFPDLQKQDPDQSSVPLYVQKPFADMRQIFTVVGPLEAPVLELAPEFLYLYDAVPRFCGGNIEFQSRDEKSAETTERLLFTAGLPQRSSEDPAYGRIDAVKNISILGAYIARDTIFTVSPY